MEVICIAAVAFPLTWLSQHTAHNHCHGDDDDDGDNIYYDDDGDDRQQGQLFFSAGEWCDFSLVQLIQKVGEHFFYFGEHCD